jgi:hypothetical protein
MVGQGLAREREERFLDRLIPVFFEDSRGVEKETLGGAKGLRIGSLEGESGDARSASGDQGK